MTGMLVLTRNWVTLIRVLFCLLVLLVAHSSHAALHVTLLRPDIGTLLLAGEHWRIYLSGEIARGDAERLVKLIADNRIPAATLYFDSPGGNLLEGLALGRLVRKLGFWTDIGRRRGETNETAGGICLSACAYAYLGGVYRFHRDDSKYGVHRFSS
jgi:hypothetical protein